MSRPAGPPRDLVCCGLARAFQAITQRGHDLGVIGEAKAAEILDLSVRELNCRIDQPGNGVIHSIWSAQ
jgi:hypothetical protein